MGISRNHPSRVDHVCARRQIRGLRGLRQRLRQQPRRGNPERPERSCCLSHGNYKFWPDDSQLNPAAAQDALEVPRMYRRHGELLRLSGSSMKRLRVLVVDDCSELANAWARVITLWGHEVTVANDGPAALQAARAARFDAALLDIDLPGMDGFELARSLRRLPGHKGLDLIAVTGRWEED